MFDPDSVTFGPSGLFRAAEDRGDAAKMAAHLADPRALVTPLWRGKVAVASEARDALVWVPPGHAVFERAEAAPVFLGLDEAGPRFARDIGPWVPDGVDESALRAFFDPNEYEHPALAPGARFGELRGYMRRLSRRDGELGVIARGLIEWHRTHPFCPRCGGRSQPVNAGWQRRCTGCGAVHFPRTDPVVIMLITHGNSVLMGRSHGWPEGMYSLLAGFVEPGETVEAAVRREVAEEAGVRVGQVGYLASQPWPFPASLMIGCRGQALSRALAVDPVELDDAKWVSREEMMAALDGSNPALRPARAGSIAHFLITNWLRGEFG